MCALFCFGKTVRWANCQIKLLPARNEALVSPSVIFNLNQKVMNGKDMHNGKQPHTALRPGVPLWALSIISLGRSSAIYAGLKSQCRFESISGRGSSTAACHADEVGIELEAQGLTLKSR